MALPVEEFKVFISHATEDGKLVSWISEALDRLHLRAFVYEMYQRGGQNRFNTIKDMIQFCPYFLVVLTKAGIASQWVNQEIGYAVAIGREPIPIIEVDRNTGRRRESKGFIELNDPISYYRNNPVGFMASVIYTFYSILWTEGKWRDVIFLSCRCGYESDMDLNFEKYWDEWQRIYKRKPMKITWICPDCQQDVSISFPDCHLLTG